MRIRSAHSLEASTVTGLIGDLASQERADRSGVEYLPQAPMGRRWIFRKARLPHAVSTCSVATAFPELRAERPRGENWVRRTVCRSNLYHIHAGAAGYDPVALRVAVRAGRG